MASISCASRDHIPPFYHPKKEGSSRIKTPLMTNNSNSTCSQRRCAFTRKCSRLVKEQRARFYIMRRCVTMLICWRDYTDDSDS